MPENDRLLGLNPADFGTTGLTLGLLVGVAFNEPERVLPRERRYGRGGGQEPLCSWRLRAVREVLRLNDVDLSTSLAATQVCTELPASETALAKSAEADSAAHPAVEVGP